MLSSGEMDDRIEFSLSPKSRQHGVEPGFQTRPPVSGDRDRLPCHNARQIDGARQHSDLSRVSLRLDEPVGGSRTYRCGATRGRYLERGGTCNGSDLCSQCAADQPKPHIATEAVDTVARHAYTAIRCNRNHRPIGHLQLEIGACRYLEHIADLHSVAAVEYTTVIGTCSAHADNRARRHCGRCAVPKHQSDYRKWHPNQP